MKKLLVLLLACIAIAWIPKTPKQKTQVHALSYIDSIAVVQVPHYKKDGVHTWDSDSDDGKYPDLYIAFGRSGVPFTTDTSKEPDKDIRNNVQTYPQTWNFTGKHIDLKNENWRIWLYDDEGGAGEWMFSSENVDLSSAKSPVELSTNLVQGLQPGFLLKVYFSKHE